MTQFKRSYTDPRSAEEAIESAGELGFEPVDYKMSGAWEAEGDVVFGGDIEEFVKAGSKYFHFRIDYDGWEREVWRCEPVESSTSNDGKLVVTFED